MGELKMMAALPVIARGSASRRMTVAISLGLVKMTIEIATSRQVETRDDS